MKVSRMVIRNLCEPFDPRSRNDVTRSRISNKRVKEGIDCISNETENRDLILAQVVVTAYVENIYATYILLQDLDDLTVNLTILPFQIPNFTITEQQPKRRLN